MLFSLRRVAPVVLFACVGLLTGCGSNNTGKIVGKWKFVSGPGLDEKELKMMEALKIYPYLEFKADGTGSVGAESSDPETQKMLAAGKDKVMFVFKYKLGSGDTVELFDLPKEMQEKGGGGPFGKKDRVRGSVKIDGDNMTLVDDDNKANPGKLTKMK